MYLLLYICGRYSIYSRVMRKDLIIGSLIIGLMPELRSKMLQIMPSLKINRISIIASL